MGIMSDLTLKLSANTADLKNGLNDATKSLNDFGNNAKTAANKITDSFKGINSTNSSIKEMRMALMSLKNISFAGKSVDEIKAINTEIGRLSNEMKHLDNQQRGTSSGLGGMATNGLKAFGALGLGIIGVGGAFEGFKKTMESTVGTADDYEIVMGQIEATTGTFFRTLANGDWSNFLTNIEIAIKSGKEYAEVMDYITHKGVGNEIQNAEDKSLVSELRLKAARLSGSKDLEARKKIYEQIEVIENRILDRNIKLSKVNYNAQVKKITDRGVDQTTLDDFVRYNDNGQGGDEQVATYRKLRKELEELKLVGKNMMVAGIQRGMSDKEKKDVADKQKSIETFLAANPSVFKFKFLIENMSDDELKAIKDAAVRVSEDIISANSRLMKPIKQEAMLDKKTGAALEKAKTEYELLTVSIKAQQTTIADILATGGTVTPEMLKALDIEQDKLYVINSTLSSINNLSKTIKPIVLSKKEISELFPAQKTPNKLKLETDKLLFNIPTPDFGTDFKIQDEKNFTKFLGGEYAKRYNLLKDSLMKGEISYEQYSQGVKDIEKDKSLYIIDQVSNQLSQVAGMMEEHTIAFKAISIATALMNTYVSATLAYRAGMSVGGPAGLVLGPVMAGLAVAAGLANVAKITGAFENGGIVGGNSYSGDKVPVRVNSGEMILNGSQQARLFAMANFGSTHSGSFAGGELTTRVSGTDLLIVLSNTNRKLNITR
jgi:hypothetical protein